MTWYTLFASLISVLSEATIVEINSGQVRGFVDTDVDGNKFFSFLGIPFAQPPVANLRFKPPVEVEAWSDVFDATKEGSPCPHVDPFSQQYQGNENCLHLNIFTRSLSDENQLKPVMFFIHGGGFAFGSNSPQVIGPKFLLAEDVVYVATNYRFGLFGSLFFDDASLGITGNMGFKDIILALKWVRDNIKKFNGDPDNVTIFGISSGGVSAHLLMLSPMAKGLFHKVISQSGNGLNSWARSHLMIAELKNETNKNTISDAMFLDYLREMQPDEIAKLFEKFNVIYAHKKRPAGYNIEPDNTPNAFLTEDPIDIILSGRYSDVPMMMGFAQAEGCSIAMINNIPIEKWSQPFGNPEDIVPYFLNYSYGSAESENIANELYGKYFGRDKIAVARCQLNSDIYFNHGIYAAIRKQSARSKSSVYYYMITLNTELNFIKNVLKINRTIIPDALHTDEFGYLFNSVYTPSMKKKSIEYKAMKMFVKLWTNFARNGNPHEMWAPVEKNGKINLMNIGEKLVLLDDSIPIFRALKELNKILAKYPNGVKYA